MDCLETIAQTPCSANDSGACKMFTLISAMVCSRTARRAQKSGFQQLRIVSGFILIRITPRLNEQPPALLPKLCLHRDFKVADTIGLRFWKTASADIDLNGW